MIVSIVLVPSIGDMISVLLETKAKNFNLYSGGGYIATICTFLLQTVSLCGLRFYESGFLDKSVAFINEK